MNQVPQHIAVIMDGNGRWAINRKRPRIEGHRAGVNNAKEIIRCAAEAGVATLSLYTFSSENRRRPITEITALMKLLASSLRDGIDELHENGIRLQFIGDLSFFDRSLRDMMRRCEERTVHCNNMVLYVAVNYSGRWDITAALRKIIASGDDLPADNAELEALITQQLTVKDVDLLIRTGDEHRISNFFLWQSAYAEIYFSSSLWPDFSAEEFSSVLAWYDKRQRRFGLTSDQIEGVHGT